MSIVTVDRETLLRNLQASKLLSKRKYALVVEKLGQLKSAREIVKALVSWKLLTKFQAQMLLMGRKSGFQVGPYRILDELGHGGMGYVYKAQHLTMRRTVALKILSPESMGTEKAQKMFRREVRAAGQLHHPNIVMAFDAAEVDGRHYLAMEYVDGPTLEQYVNQHGTLPSGVACEIIFQAAGGLQHAHEKGVVHRDIKPANLLLQQESSSKALQVKILDFGLARLRDAAGAPSSGEHALMGTPDFLSPEQTKDLRSADIRSDLYSLGCAFYFLLTGQVPYPGGNVLHKLNRHDREVARPLEELCPEVPKNIARIVRKLMAKNPADRYQTPDELMDALAPHAVPSSLDWPPARERGRDNSAKIRASEADTLPGGKAPRQSSAQDSILEWIDTNRKQTGKAHPAALSRFAR
jgi:serine/threonine protein kinase